jgi:GNAT superfamily N-acetyltransferase
MAFGARLKSEAVSLQGSITVRGGLPTDFEAIDAFDPFAGDRRDALASDCCLVAECDGRVVGYVVYSRAGFVGRPFIHFLVVAQDYRRRGVATELVAAVEARIGSGRLFVSTEENNGDMLALLAKLGWTSAGCIQGVNMDGPAECFFFRDIAPT